MDIFTRIYICGFQKLIFIYISKVYFYFKMIDKFKHAADINAYMAIIQKDVDEKTLSESMFVCVMGGVYVCMSSKKLYIFCVCVSIYMYTDTPRTYI